MSMPRRGLGYCGLLILVSCGGGSVGPSSDALGTLGLRLQAEVNHAVYRVRDGLFEVTGPQRLTLESEDSVGAVSLEAALLQGAYQVELIPGWRLEREFPDGFATLEAALISDNPRQFTINAGQTTQLLFEFLTDGTRVGLGSGSIDLGIGVTDTSQTCVIGAVQQCEGHAGLDGIGLCRAGVRLCLPGPNNATSQFGPCMGSVGPVASDLCAVPGDDSNCNGIANDGCPVSPPPCDCGADQSCNEATQQCEALPPSFERDLWPIFQAQCTPCHTSRRAGGHSVGSADLAIAFADATRVDGRLIQRLDGGGMPPACSGLPGDPGCISVEDLAKIQLWLDSGMSP